MGGAASQRRQRGFLGGGVGLALRRRIRRIASQRPSVIKNASAWYHITVSGRARATGGWFSGESELVSWKAIPSPDSFQRSGRYDASWLEPKNTCTAKNTCTRFASKKITQPQTTSHNSKNGRFSWPKIKLFISPSNPTGR